MPSRGPRSSTRRWACSAPPDVSLVEEGVRPVTRPRCWSADRSAGLVTASVPELRARPRGPQAVGTTRAVAMAATPSPRPVRPRPSVVVAETVTGAPAAGAEAGLRLGATGAEPGPVADHLDRDVADREARGADPCGGLGQQRGAGGAGPGGVGRAELGAQVAQPGGRQQGVAGSVRGDVTVGVTLQPVVLVGPGQSGQVHRDAGREAVDVDTDAHTRDGRHRAVRRRRSQADHA